MAAHCIEPEKLYARDPKLKREDVEILQEWLKKQAHLPQIEESQVIIFLHSCYYKIERAKLAIDAFFTIRTHHPEIFQCATENILRQTCAISANIHLPKRTPEGYLITLGKLIDYSVEKYNFVHQLKVHTMSSALHSYKNGFANGVLVILDSKNFTLGHFTRINLAVLKTFTEFVQEATPVRIKGVHFVNAVPFMDKILGLLKPFLRSELYKLIQVHTSFDTLYKYIPKECLPEDYKGFLPSVQVLRDENLQLLLENLDFFEWLDCQKVDESKRTENKNSVNNIFGMDGTFKKLELD